jgi:tRNA (adenine57-N1/adenine58-N1)-methyltransferase
VTNNREFKIGDRVLIIDSKKRRYLATLSERGEFHSHSGVVTHQQIIGQLEGA